MVTLPAELNSISFLLCTEENELQNERVKLSAFSGDSHHRPLWRRKIILRYLPRLHGDAIDRSPVAYD